MSNQNPFKQLSSRQIHETELISIREDQVVTGFGPQHSFTAITLKVCGIAVLPIDAEGKTRFVGQHRYVPDRYTWELVRGAGSRTDPLGSAQRELGEETGLEAEHWLQVLELMPCAGLTDEKSPCFVAWGTREGRQHTDETENLRIRKVSFDEAVRLVLSGEVQDAPSCALILATYVRAQRGNLPPELIKLLAVTPISST